MDIRHATMRDYDEMLSIYAYAREQMKRTGNPNQWGDHRPSRETIMKDIELGQSYVVCDGSALLGAFALTFGDEENYRVIENGQWLNDEPYCVIHRVASAGKAKGVLSAILAFCEGQSDNVRLDTHDDNRIMQHLLEKHGYAKCGRVYIEGGAPRIGYHKIVR